MPDQITEKTGRSLTEAAVEATADQEEALSWLERTLPRIMRRLMDAENLDMPLLQLPLAQMRLAQGLYRDSEGREVGEAGETMGKLSDRLGVRQNALTQAADRLVNHGLAERLSDPTDRRIVRLRLTEKGREWVRARRARRRARFEELWTLLSPEERDTFLQAVRTLETAGDRLAALNNSAPITTQKDADQAAPLPEETLSRFTVGAANGAAAKIDNPK
jgi:DNA-binding MarR family transcriptional regulator